MLISITLTDVLYPGQSNLINFEGKEYSMHDYCETLINCKGKDYYLACRTGYDFLEKFYGKIASDLIPKLPIAKFNSRVSIQMRENKLEKYWFVQNFSDKEEKIELSCELVNLLADVKDKGTVSLKPVESKVYTLCR